MFGEDAARRLAYTHEFFGSDGPNDTYIDFYNNEIGYRVADMMLNSSGKPSFLETMEFGGANFVVLLQQARELAELALYGGIAATSINDVDIDQIYIEKLMWDNNLSPETCFDSQN